MAEIVSNSIASKVLEKVVDLLVVPIGKHICYPFKYESNMEDLKQQVEKLINARNRVQHSVDTAKGQGDEIEKDVEEWLDSVDKFAAQLLVKSIIGGEEDRAEKTAKDGVDLLAEKTAEKKEQRSQQRSQLKLCSIGFCPNLISRYSLSKKAAKTAKDGVDLLAEGKFKNVWYRLAIRRTKSVYTRGYEDFGSRMPVFEKIMKALAEEDVNLIGVYGMGGVGKTTLVKKVAAQVLEDQLFDRVVMAEVTQTLDIENIQEQIANGLGLEFQEKSLSGRAARLHDRLKKETNVLVILDNIWEKLNLDYVGIPSLDDERASVTQEVVDEQGRNAYKRQCKLLLTSRDLDVLNNDMNTQKNFLVEVLFDIEAMDLFWKIAGHSREKPDFNRIAVEIVSKCAGLPIAITTIANALKNKDVSDWKDALRWLRRSNPKPIKGMEASVYSTIDLSYNILGSEEQSFFLLCCLITSGRDSDLFKHSMGLYTSDLFKYSMGLGLFKDADTMEEARNRMHTLIGNLKASCLLLDGNDKDKVEMHDIIQAVAVSIASSKDKLMFNIQNVTSIKETLEEKLPKDSIAVSFPYGDIDELPERLEFPKLELLHLWEDEVSLQIPDAFFDGVKELKVLNLTGFHLLSLPSSLCKLTNLQTLCLDQCLIGDIKIIGELKKLEILSFLKSEFEQLPGEIRQLTRLRLLDLSDCSKLKVITPNVLSSLTRLEELYMGNSFVQWDVEGQSNASLAELKQLSNLTTLEIHVLDAQIVPHDLFVWKLERYRIFIGDVWDWSGKYETSRTLKLKLNNSFFLSDGIKFLLNRAEDLYLDELEGVKNVLHELNGEGFQQLKHLHIQNAPQVQYIINSVGWGLCSIFPQRLESLVLNNDSGSTNSCADIYPLLDKKVSLPSLRELKLNSISSEVIWHSQLLATSSSLHNLTLLRIFGLDDLKYLFSSSMANSVVQLNILEIIDCQLMEAVIVEEVQGSSAVLFPNLRDLTVCNLPKLSRFCYFNRNLIDPCSSLEQNMTASEECSGMDSKENLHANIQPLFDEKVGFPSLEKMVVSGMDNLMSIWHNRFIGDSYSFHKLKSVEVNDCQELMTIFPSCICGRLLSLESLIVKSCGSVKEIFDLRGINLKEKHFIQETTQLRELYVDHLSNLKHIWNDDPEGILSYGKLEKVTIFLCPNLENLFPASVAKSLLNLDSLEVSDCGVEEIISKEGGVKKAAADRFLFPQLSSLQLHNLPRLRIFYPGHTVEGPCLKSLGLHHCDKVTLFISEFLGIYETIEEGQLDISIHEQPPFFLVQEIEGTNQLFPNLEELQLSGKAIAMRWPSQVPGRFFHSLKSLELNNHESTVVPLDFIQRFGNLEKLSLNSSSYNKEIFSYGKDKEHPEIKHLVLSGLFDLKQIWKQGSKIDPNFQNLQILEVRSCFNLINLMPSSASFRNLMILEVWGCDGLKNLLTSSTAKSLVLLEKLEVFDCKILTEVVANEGAVPEEIVFGNLKSLSLVYLQSLASFCFTKHTLNFPILESLVVNECPKMKIFSEGVTSTPKLHKLELNWEAIEQSWEVDVNTTIQQNMERRYVLKFC